MHGSTGPEPTDASSAVVDPWDAVLSAMQTSPRDADELLAALRKSPPAAQFAQMGQDSDASSLVAIARTALATDFAEPCELAGRDGIAFVVDTYEWAIGGAVAANEGWPHNGPWHHPSAPVALLNRPERVVVFGPAVTLLALEVLGRGALYARMHDPYAVRAACSLADWAAHHRNVVHEDRRPERVRSRRPRS